MKLGSGISIKQRVPLDREPRTVIHVKRAKMFDPVG